VTLATNSFRKKLVDGERGVCSDLATAEVRGSANLGVDWWLSKLSCRSQSGNRPGLGVAHPLSVRGEEKSR